MPVETSDARTPQNVKNTEPITIETPVPTETPVEDSKTKTLKAKLKETTKALKESKELIEALQQQIKDNNDYLEALEKQLKANAEAKIAQAQNFDKLLSQVVGTLAGLHNVLDLGEEAINAKIKAYRGGK